MFALCIHATYQRIWTTATNVSLFRKGSVIADIELTFNETVGENEVKSLLSEAVKDGSLGQLQVDEFVVGTTIIGEHHVTVIVYYIPIYLCCEISWISPFGTTLSLGTVYRDVSSVYHKSKLTLH